MYMPPSSFGWPLGRYRMCGPAARYFAGSRDDHTPAGSTTCASTSIIGGISVTVMAPPGRGPVLTCSKYTLFIVRCERRRIDAELGQDRLGVLAERGHRSGGQRLPVEQHRRQQPDDRADRGGDLAPAVPGGQVRMVEDLARGAVDGVPDPGRVGGLLHFLQGAPRRP